jgi:hypothetical protein
MVGFGLLATAALAAGRRLADGRGPRVALAARVIALVLVLGIALDICLTNQRVMQQGLEPILPRGQASADFFQNSAADYGRLATYPVAGYGTRGCYVALEWKPAPGIVDGRVPQARLEPPTAGTISPTRWSPNRLAFDVQLDAPAVVIINQNYESGWQVNGGETVGAYVAPERRFWDIRAHPSDLPAKGAIGLIAVPLAPGTHNLTLSHRPPWLWPGAFLSLAGLVLVAAIVGRGGRRARLRG